MNNYLWFKHPENLSIDKRLSELLNKEGARGYGTYIYIIEMLQKQIDGRMNISRP